MTAIQKEAQNIFEKMSIEEQVGQLFILAFPGKNPAILSEIVHQYGIAGCYISQENAETFGKARTLCKELENLVQKQGNPLPLILGVDQEGSWGVLVPESTIGPGNLALGISDDTTHTKMMYQIFAREMASVGYNTILAPCSDVNLNPQNPIIGTRSFGEIAERVARHVLSAVTAVKEQGIFCSAKHFPGHGDTVVDSHRDIPVVNKSLDVLLKQELLPFQAAVDGGADLIMTSHILFPQLDPKYPATLSRFILTDLLRKKMGFNGLIITDSMNMGAIRKHYDPKESSVLAFLAGADLIMLSEEHYDHDSHYLEKQKASIEGIVNAVKIGKIPKEILHDRVLRVLQKRIELRNSLNEGKIYKEISKEEFIGFKEQEGRAAQRAVHILLDTDKLLPLQKQQCVALVNCTPTSSYHNLVNVRGIGPNQKIPAFQSFVQEFQNHQPARVFDFKDLESVFAEKLNEFDKIIAVTEDYPLPGEDFEKVKQKAMVQMLIDHFKGKLIVLGLRSPYELKDYQDLQCYVCTYSSRTCSAIAAAKMFCTDNSN